MTHDQVWRDGWLLVAAFGAGFGLLVSPLAALALYLAFATATLAAMLVRQPSRRWRAGPPVAPIPLRSLAGRAGSIGLCAVGFVAVSATAPALTLSLTVLVMLTSPWLWRRVRAVARPADEPPPLEPRLPWPRRPSEALAPEPTVPSGMSDEQLAAAWRRSSVTLTHTRSPAFTLAVVSLRAAYLDELERRDPQAFQLWLTSQARADGTPHRSLGEEPPRGTSDASP